MQARIDAGEDVVVGVNKYRLPEGKAETVDVLRIDNSSVLQSQIQGALPALPCLVCGICAGSPLLVPPLSLSGCRHPQGEGGPRRAGCRGGAEEALCRGGNERRRWQQRQGEQPLVPSAAHRIHQPASPVLSRQEHNLLKLAVEAARARATLGEISLALEQVWGRHVASSQVVQGAYNASFNAAAGSSGAHKGVEEEYAAVLGQVKAFADKEGRRPRILVAKMGQDGHDRGAKVHFARGFGRNCTMMAEFPVDTRAVRRLSRAVLATWATTWTWGRSSAPLQWWRARPSTPTW
jgi:hypothetical protein